MIWLYGSINRVLPPMARGAFFLDTKTLPNLRLRDCNPFFIIGNIKTVDVMDRASP